LAGRTFSPRPFPFFAPLFTGVFRRGFLRSSPRQEAPELVHMEDVLPPTTALGYPRSALPEAAPVGREETRKGEEALWIWRI
jgi:hypothetical protein